MQSWHLGLFPLEGDFLNAPKGVAECIKPGTVDVKKDLLRSESLMSLFSSKHNTRYCLLLLPLSKLSRLYLLSRFPASIFNQFRMFLPGRVDYIVL